MSLIDIARKEIGYQEEAGNNNKYAKYFKKGGDNGINYVSWCAIFVSYCLELDKNPLFYHLKDKNGNMRAGSYQRVNTYCPSIQQHFKENGRLFQAKDKTPQCGDIVLFCWNPLKDPTADHIGIVESYNNKTGMLTTIEGNTSSGNVGSQSNGDGVYRRIRHISLTCGFIRPK